MVCYNEEQFIERVLKGVTKIADIDAIEILDGAWEHGGKTSRSSDNTRDIIKSFDIGIPINFTEPEAGKLWSSEPSKRNAQLQMVEKIYGKGNYTFWLDADEQIRFPNGLISMNLKPWLMEELCGIIKSYGLGGDMPFPGPRIIPTGMEYHWHTGVAMHIHDKDCKTVMDFNGGLTNPNFNPTLTYPITRLFIVNWWEGRNNERLYGDKLNYWKWQEENKQNVQLCIWNSKQITPEISL
jgi:hypothetical protein